MAENRHRRNKRRHRLTCESVYTTAAPRITVRPQPDFSAERTDSSGARLTQEPAAIEGRGDAPMNEDITPHASRHVSASDVRDALHATEAAAASASSPLKQPQRSSSSPLPSVALAADIRQTLRQSIDQHLNGEDSPVLNETLSVIDEHITDLSTPRHSLVASDPRLTTDSGSEYSSHISHRLSYINGHETDEEEENQVTEQEVRRWDCRETANHLRGLGVEARHCEIFEEQEITGDVLLDMNQDFIFMKEFDFGVMGRRLKSWHKIKAFQEEIKGLNAKPRASVSTTFSGLDGLPEGRSLSRAGHAGPLLPRIPSLSERSPKAYAPARGSPVSTTTQHPRLMSSAMSSQTESPVTSQSSYGMDVPRRPSAASIRDINHSRRHSSMDSSARSPELDLAASRTHRKKPSLDRAWTMSNSPPGLAPRPGTSSGTTSDGLLPQHVFRGAVESKASDPATPADEHFDELERGYFSGTEVDARRRRRVLQKRGSTGGSVSHSRNSSYVSVTKRHSRIASAESIRDAAAAATHVSPAALAYHEGSSPKSRFARGPGARPSTQGSHSRVGDEHSGGIGSGFFASIAPLIAKSDADSSGRSSPLPLQQIRTAAPKFRRAMGLRAISDVVTKGIDTSASPTSPVSHQDLSSARTGSTTPSATSFKSSERHSTDGSGKAADAAGASTSTSRFRTSAKGTKSKKDTSAYTRGLEKKAPREQMDGCDYSGWMKKRSSHIMTTWKPRLFVLRGRRLSYYYSERDTEERGLIDITAHRVLRADNDPIIALHATLTGATSAAAGASSSSNSHSRHSVDRGSSTSSTTKSANDGPFFFKLVPPKSSRTVQFTKPAIHYFQVDSVQEGRLWMAAMMKATIERDMSLAVETTNKQKTISLKQARLMNQRPPELLMTKITTTPTTTSAAASTAASAAGADKQMPIASAPPGAAEAAAAAPESGQSVSDDVHDPDRDHDNDQEHNHGLMIRGLSFDKQKPTTGGADTNEMAEATTSAAAANLLGDIDTGPTSFMSEAMTESP